MTTHQPTPSPSALSPAATPATPAAAGTTRPRMRALVQDAYGSAEVLRLDEIERPSVAPDEVLVQVKAGGLDRGTWHLLTGKPYLMRVIGFGFRRPKNRVPGLDVAGTVVEVGSEVTKFVPGDEVFGISRGAYAEYAVALEAKLAPKPHNLTFEQAAAVPISGITALQALRDAGRVRAGQRVLVIGASGGVGTYAVQLAVAFGARVTGVSRTSKQDLVRSLGAEEVIDYTSQDFAEGNRRYDLILDLGGNTGLSRLRRALATHGTLVIVGGEAGGNLTGGMGRQLRALALSPFVRQRLTAHMTKEGHEDLERLAQLIQVGDVMPAVERTYPLSDVPAALRDLEAGRIRGKVAITI